MAATRIPAVQNFVATGAVRLLADDAKSGCRPFEMDAYTGAPVETWFGREVVDLSGLELPGKAFPILRDHDRGNPIGYSASASIAGSSLVVKGSLTTNASGREVAEMSDQGFPWQASMGFRVLRAEEIKAGDSKTVNGKKFAGPGTVITKSRLLECSFVPLGADGATSARALASASDDTVEVEMSDPTTNQPAQNDMARLAALEQAFADRPAFVIAQFKAGHDVTQAKAALSDVLLAEKSETDKALSESRAEVDRLKASKGSVGVVALASSEARSAAPAEDNDADLDTFEQRAKKKWKADKALRSEFAAVAGDEEDGAFKAFCAYFRAEEKGLVAIKSVNGTITR